MGEEDLEVEKTSLARGEDQRDDEAKIEERKVKKKKRPLKEAVKGEKRGVCHLRRVPPRMDHVKLRQVLSQFGEIQRIYLVPEAPAAQMNRKRAGGFRGQSFSEGWVEFTKKCVAKRIANMLNGQQIGGRKRSSFYYDIWNIKYLSKINWDDISDEIAQRHAIHEQKLALELSAATRERDFYLTQVDKSKALSSIEERMKKKRKVQQESGEISNLPSEQIEPRVIRQFPQKKHVADEAGKIKRKLSKEILAGVQGTMDCEDSLIWKGNNTRTFFNKRANKFLMGWKQILEGKCSYQSKAKKIENLNPMVLRSNSDEGGHAYKKDKWRYTWCSSNLSRKLCKRL